MVSLKGKKEKYIIDLVERVVWTGLETVSAAGIVEAFDINVAYTAPIAVGLATVKGILAKLIGSSNTAATLPATDDTPIGVPAPQ